MLKRVSTATCNGCHAGNTGTMVIHVDLGAVAPRLSSFLLGDGKPAACGNDRRPGSGDLEARLCQMQALANASDNALDCDRPEAFSSIGETEILLSLPNPSLSSPTASLNLTDFLVERADRVH